MRAAGALLDRGYGRPLQGVELKDKQPPPILQQFTIIPVKPGERISLAQKEKHFLREDPVKIPTGLLATSLHLSPARIKVGLCSEHYRKQAGIDDMVVEPKTASTASVGEPLRLNRELITLTPSYGPRTLTSQVSQLRALVFARRRS